jgi:hypothetical protein
VPTPPTFRLRWHTIFIAALTIGLLWWFLRKQDLRETASAIRRAHWGLIVAAIASVFVTYVLRAWRWQALLQPLGPARFRTAFRTTVIGFMATFLLPARVGEVLRAPGAGSASAGSTPAPPPPCACSIATVLPLFAVPSVVGRERRARHAHVGVSLAAWPLALIVPSSPHPAAEARFALRLTWARQRLSAWRTSRRSSGTQVTRGPSGDCGPLVSAGCRSRSGSG